MKCSMPCSLVRFLPVLLGLILAMSSESPVQAADQPNVLFIISDDLSAEALSCYGNEQCQTPAIDSIAERGIRFTRAYCQFPICGPSRAALMSGMYPESIGVMGNGGANNFTKNLGDRPSMSQHFRNHDYYVARVSKIYHMRVPGDITAGVSGPDHEASWTERFNMHAPEWMTKGEHIHLTNENLNFDKDKHYGLGFGGAFYVVKGESDGREQPDVMATDKAIELMKAHRDEPFFLAVGLVRPHVPLVAPASYYDPYPPKEMQLAPEVENDLADIPKPGISKTSRSSGLAGKPGKQQEVLSAYYASVAFMDAQVGRLLEALRELDLDEETIVVFTSDHGYHLGEHSFWQKMSLHEESARIPLVISTPSGPAGSTSEALAEQIDLYPTLAELSGLDVPEHVQGKSLAPVIRGEAKGVRRAAYSVTGNGQLLRTDKWAYIKYRDGSQELYNMENDPRQYRNLADSADHADILQRMDAAVTSKRNELKPKAGGRQ